jgi:hypothetical protein
LRYINARDCNQWNLLGGSPGEQELSTRLTYWSDLLGETPDEQKLSAELTVAEVILRVPISNN